MCVCLRVCGGGGDDPGTNVIADKNGSGSKVLMGLVLGVPEGIS